MTIMYVITIKLKKNQQVHRVAKRSILEIKSTEQEYAMGKLTLTTFAFRFSATLDGPQNDKY
uniref:Uncharacterized protein n=1 Tax=Romanomermis culicivorax TaxID=13658 RepID=A0A915KFW5_ROMCU